MMVAVLEYNLDIFESPHKNGPTRLQDQQPMGNIHDKTSGQYIPQISKYYQREETGCLSCLRIGAPQNSE